MSLARYSKSLLEKHAPGAFCALLDLRDRLRPDSGEPELAFLPWLCDSESLAVDVGANHGAYTAALLRVAGRVVACEPNPRLVRVLERRFAAPLRGGRLRLVAAAVSDRDGEVELFIPHQASALASTERRGGPAEMLAGESIKVPCRRLDSLGLEGLGFLKIDVEGHETAVLDGARDSIARDRPSLLIEAEERHNPGAVEWIRGFLGPLGYQGFYLLEGRLRPVGDFDAARLQNPAALDPAGTRRLKGQTYINNFLFIQRPAVLDRIPAALRPR